MPSPPMDGFKADYEKLLQLFLTVSRATGPELVDPTDRGSLLAPSTSSISQLAASDAPTPLEPPKVYDFTFYRFTECFKKLNFSAIFCGHRNANSLREFFDQMSKYLLDQLSVKQPIENRIFSFYLIYSLWFLQLKSYKLSFKIRIDRPSFANLQDLVNYSSKQQQFDIVLSYRKLFLAGAFAFCEAIELYGPYYKSYLARKALPNSQETELYLEQFKADKQNYCQTLEMLEDGNLATCDNLMYHIKRFEDNCF